MKKVLSLVLVLALVLGSFGMAFADTDTTSAAATATTPKDVVGTDYEGAVTALTALGVVSGYEDGNYKPANIVTRAEMAKLIIAELGLTGNATGAKSTFTDLSGYGWAEGFIGYAQSLGIINGYGDGTFKPGQSVSYDEALTMIVSALGYTKDCKEMNGSWPAIYVQKARVLGITDDVKAGGAVGANRGDIAIYLYNMLTADMGYADADGRYVTKKDKNDDPIKVITNLDAEESKNVYEGYQIIEKSDADDALVNIKPYVGSFAKVFTMTKGKNDGKIIAISDVKSDFISGEYDAANKKLTAVDGAEYKLDDVMNGVEGTSTEKYLKDTKKSIEFINGDRAAVGSTVLTTNGNAFDDTTANKDGRFVTIAADLSGKTVKGVYSVMMWGMGSNATVVDDKIDADDLKSITSNKTLLGKDFTQNDNDEIDMNSFELVGVSSLSDIEEGNIVYVYTGGKDKEITRIAVGTETVEGEITAIKESNSNSTKVTLGGKTYKLAKEKLGNNGITGALQASDLDTEDEVKLYLDAYGYAYDYDAISGKADNYAIVLKTGSGNGSIGSKNEIKLFLADGTDKIFNVDNDLFKSGKTVPGVTNTTGIIATAGAIVKYGVDKDGLIDSFETLVTDVNNKDYKLLGISTAVTPTFKNSDITKTGYFNGYEIKKDAVMFSFNGLSAFNEVPTPVDRTDEDEYGTTTLEKVLDKEDIDAAYVVYKNKIVAMLMYDFSDSDNVYGVATGARRTAGDADYEIDMLVNGGTKTYPVANNSAYTVAKNSQSADNQAGQKLFKIDFNASNEVKGLVPAYTDLASAGDTMGYVHVSVGANSSYKDNLFKFGAGASTDGASTPATMYSGGEVRLDSKATVYYNDDGDFATGTLSDLKGLKSGSEIWFFDTEDDKNDLANIIVIYKTDTASGSTGGGANITGTDKVEDVDLTSFEVVIGGETYKLTGSAKKLFVAGIVGANSNITYKTDTKGNITAITAIAGDVTLSTDADGFNSITVGGKLTISTSAAINDVTVGGDVVVDASGENVTISALTIKGDVDIQGATKVTIKDTSITGKFSALSPTELDGTVTVKGKFDPTNVTVNVNASQETKDLLTNGVVTTSKAAVTLAVGGSDWTTKIANASGVVVYYTTDAAVTLTGEVGKGTAIGSSATGDLDLNAGSLVYFAFKNGDDVVKWSVPVKLADINGIAAPTIGATNGAVTASGTAITIGAIKTGAQYEIKIVGADGNTKTDWTVKAVETGNKIELTKTDVVAGDTVVVRIKATATKPGSNASNILTILPSHIKDN